MQSIERHPSKHFYHGTFCASYTNAVFRTNRFCLKITAIKISSILRMSFVNMFLNNRFTKSTEDEILSKIRTQNKVTLTQKNSLFSKVNEETLPHIKGYLSQSLLSDNWVVNYLQDELDIKK